MFFEYGSNSLDVPNPFKKEGLTYILAGLLILIIGVISLLTLRARIVEGGTSSGWLVLIVCIITLSYGLYSVGKGLFKTFRFYVGRGIPAGLSLNVAKSEVHADYQKLQNNQLSVAYTPEMLEQMLVGRKNPTFEEPEGFVARMLYNFFPKLLFVPVNIRNNVYLLFCAAIYTIIYFLAYLTLRLSSVIGLVHIDQSWVGQWTNIILLVLIVIIWHKNIPSKKRIFKSQLKPITIMKTVLVIMCTVLLPIILDFLFRKGLDLPHPPISTLPYMLLIFLLIVITLFIGSYLAIIRSNGTNPVTEVSERREHWQESIHPDDFFRAFDTELARFRFKEIPNRIYKYISPQLNVEGSKNKGSFFGETIQETQPVYQEFDTPKSFKKMLFISSSLGQLLIIGCFTSLFVNSTFGLNGANLFIKVFNLVFLPLIFWIFGYILVHTANIYLSEVQFCSYLIHFQGEGTYSESVISTGMAYNDTIRSENYTVNCSMTPCIIATKIISSTFAESGSKNLENNRYVIEMHRSDSFLQEIYGSVRDFVDNYQKITSIKSDKDIHSIGILNAVNNQANANKELTSIEPGMIQE